jgi:chemotaxis protein methyltransferase CheR
MIDINVTAPDLERFRNAILRVMGLQFDDAKLGLLSEVLGRRLAKRRALGQLYLAELETNPPPEECVALAEELTVTETYFFRNRDQFDALAGVVLPDRMARHGEPRTLKFLSAGCSSGEEAYSLAIVGLDSLRDPGWEVSVRAADLNPVVLGKARRARYSDWSLRETPATIRQRWFVQDGRDWTVVPEVRERVSFETVNMAASQGDLWREASYDVVFCRNMLMYFSAEQRRAAIARLARALMPGGYLFVGHAESLTGLSDAFHLCHTHDTFYYQRKEDSERARPVPVAPPPRPYRAGTVYDSAWSETIRAASERVAALLPETAPTELRRRGNDLAPALDLLRSERFAEALDYIGNQPDAADPGALLLSAVLQQQSGKLVEAEQTCRRLLEIDDLSAGAHYVLALCRENAGDLAASAEHDRIAAYLDPAFAMPRLHLGLLARRGGAREETRRELAQALILLEGESTARLLMFGGGFNRQALIALCRATLAESGGRP